MLESHSSYHSYVENQKLMTDRNQHLKATGEVMKQLTQRPHLIHSAKDTFVYYKITG